jgi:hypothetical protein
MRFNRKYLILALIIIISLVIFDQFYQLKYYEGAANKTPPSAAEINEKLVIVENILNGTTKEVGDITIPNCIIPGQTPTRVPITTTNKTGLSYNESFQAILGLTKNAIGNTDITAAKNTGKAIMTGAVGETIPYFPIYCKHLQNLLEAITFINTNSPQDERLTKILYNTAIPFYDETTKTTNMISFKASMSYSVILVTALFSLGTFPVEEKSQVYCLHTISPNGNVAGGFLESTVGSLTTLLANYSKNLYMPTTTLPNIVYSNDVPVFITYITGGTYPVGANPNKVYYPYAGKSNTNLFNVDDKGNVKRSTPVPFPAQISGPNIMPPLPTTTSQPTTTTTPPKK